MTNAGNKSLTQLLRVSSAFLKVLFRLLAVGARVLVSVLRSKENRRRVRQWFLLEADRWTVVNILIGSVFVTTFALGLTDVIGVRESGFVTTMFSTIIAGLFSFVPLVIAINQISASRVLGSPDRLRQRIESVERFRGNLEGMISDVAVSTTDPAGFLQLTYRAINERSTALEAACSGCPDAACRQSVAEYSSAITARTEAVTEHLDDDLHLWSVLLPVMNDTYSKRQNEARRIQNAYGDVLPPEADEMLSELQELLTIVDVTRQYFKSVYLQQELARLSRQIAYSGGAAFLISMLVIMLYASGYPPAVGGLVLLLLVTVSLAIAFSPFAILFSYILRIATILKRTSAPGAFTPKGERPPQFWKR